MWLRNKKLVYYNNNNENAKLVKHEYEVIRYAYILRDGKYCKLEEKN